MKSLHRIMTSKDEARFHDLFQRGDVTSCWIWNGTTNKADYPLFYMQGKMVSALKLQYALIYHEPVADGQILAHHCDRRDCVNPDHIYTTTHSALSAHEFQTGKLIPPHHLGARNPNAKLTACQVQAIRQHDWQGDTITVLAARYDVTPVTISRITHYHLWKHVA